MRWLRDWFSNPSKGRRRIGIVSVAVVLALVGTFIGVDFGFEGDAGERGLLRIGQGDNTITIGTAAYAAPVADYTCDGIADDVQFQAALNALPATGGQIFVLAGTYTFAATVTRAVDRVTIEGVGGASFFQFDAATPIFSAGVQSWWSFRDFRTDAGGVTVVAASNYLLENVTLGATYHAYTFAGGFLGSSTSLSLQCSGDVDDYLTFNTVANVPTLYGTGSYIRIGDASVIHAGVAVPTEDDFHVSGRSSMGNNAYMGDDLGLYQGVGSDVYFIFETADANAQLQEWLFAKATANEVPVLVLGDTTIAGIDLGAAGIDFSGVVQPRLAIIDDDADSWVAIGFNANDDARIMIGGSSVLTMPAFTLGGQVTAYAGSGLTRSETRVVAANDSSAISKLQADYVCDATDDHVQIQAAINALPTGTRLETMAGAFADDGGVITDERLEANDTTPNNMVLLPAVPVVGDAYYFGGFVRSNTLTMNIGTAGSAPTLTITWEYWNGAAWVGLAGVVDGTNSFSVGGTNDVTFTMPNDWVATTIQDTDVGSLWGYWIRARLSAFANGGYVQPLGTQCWIEVDAGGGAVKLLEGNYSVDAAVIIPSNVSVRGSGIGTVVKVVDGATGPWAVFQNADTTGGNYNIVIADMLIDCNAYEAMVDSLEAVRFDTVDWSRLENLTVLNGGSVGGLRSVKQFNNSMIINNTILNPMNDGMDMHTVNHNIFRGNQVRGSRDDLGMDIDAYSCYNTLEGNICHYNWTRGILVGYGCNYNIIKGNDCSFNQSMGISVNGGVAASDYANYNIIEGNMCRENGSIGIRIGQYCDHNLVKGNYCIANSQLADNTHDGIQLTTYCDYNMVIGNVIRRGALTRKQRYGIATYEQHNRLNVFRDNDLHDSGTTGAIGLLSGVGVADDVAIGNRGTTTREERDVVYMKNTSGGVMAQGEVVMLKAVAAGDEVDTPGGVGVDNVFGMVLSATIANGDYGYIQVFGFTVRLKATNAGGGNILVGDLLGTEVGDRARKAAAGHMCFAVALEGLAAADGYIDALLIVPRKM